MIKFSYVFFKALLAFSLLFAQQVQANGNYHLFEFGEEFKGEFTARYSSKANSNKLKNDTVKIKLDQFDSLSGRGRIAVQMSAYSDLGRCSGYYIVSSKDVKTYLVHAPELRCEGLQNRKPSWINVQLDIPKKESRQQYLTARLGIRWGKKDLVSTEAKVKASY